MKNEFVLSRTVEFADTDMAGIVHFTAFFRYMETTEHELFRSMGFSISDQRQGYHIGWPRVSCSFDFFHPLCFPDKFEIHLTVVQIDTRSVTYESQIVRDGKLLARGRSRSTCCRIKPNGELYPVDIPVAIADKLIAYAPNHGNKDNKTSEDKYV